MNSFDVELDFKSEIDKQCEQGISLRQENQNT